MAQDQELLIKISGKADQFTDELDRVKKKTKNLEAALTKTAKVSAAGFAAMTAVIGGSVAVFSAFESKFGNVITLLDKGSFSTKTLTKGIDDLKAGVLSLSAESGEGLETLNQGLFDLISSGTNAEDAIDSLRVATELATAGATDTATAVKALSATTTAFGESAGTAREIAEKFFTAQKFGVTTVGELAREFNKVGGIAKNLGISFDETLASLSALTADGAKPTAEAATQLKAAFNSIILVQSKLKGETKAVQNALSLQNVKQRGLVKSLELLKEATGGSIPEMQRLVGSSEALGVVLSLTGGQAELVKTQIAELADEEKRAATFAEALKTKQETTERAMAKFKATLTAATTVLGEQFAPLVNKLANFLGAATKRFVELDKKSLGIIATTVKVIAGFLGIVAAVSTAALAYLKLKAILIATNSVFKISTIATKAWALTVAFGTKALKLFRAGLTLATASARGLAAATGIGLVIVALGFMIANLDKTVAVAKGTFSAIGAIITSFADAAKNILGNFGQLMRDIFSGNFSNVEKSVNQLKGSLVKGFSEVGTAAAESFKESYNQSLKDSAAGSVEGPTVAGGGVAGGPDFEGRNTAQKESNEKSLEINRQFREDLRNQNSEEAEADAEQAAALQEILDETGIALDSREIEAHKNKILTKRQAEKLAAKEKLKSEIKARNQFTKDELKFGKEIAEFKQGLGSQEVKDFKQTSGQLAALQSSAHEGRKKIGKAAATVQVAINTAQGAIAAYSSLAGIPVVGPVLGAAAAGAVVAFGGEQLANINRAQGGGVVPAAIGGSRDRSLTLTEPGELIVPKELTPNFIQAVGRPEGVFEGEDETTSSELFISIDGDGAEEFITIKQNEADALGTSQRAG